MLPIDEMNIKYRTEPTFRYLIVGIRYFSVFQIDVGIGMGFFSKYRCGIFGIPTHDYSGLTNAGFDIEAGNPN